jgi:hypothetical protein
MNTIIKYFITRLLGPGFLLCAVLSCSTPKKISEIRLRSKEITPVYFALFSFSADETKIDPQKTILEFSTGQKIIPDKDGFVFIQPSKDRPFQSIFLTKVTVEGFDSQEISNFKIIESKSPRSLNYCGHINFKIQKTMINENELSYEWFWSSQSNPELGFNEWSRRFSKYKATTRVVNLVLKTAPDAKNFRGIATDRQQVVPGF